MNKQKLKKLTDRPAFREARPLLVSMTIGFSLALIVAATASLQPGKTASAPNADAAGAAPAQSQMAN